MVLFNFYQGQHLLWLLLNILHRNKFNIRFKQSLACKMDWHVIVMSQESGSTYQMSTRLDTYTRHWIGSNGAYTNSDFTVVSVILLRRRGRMHVFTTKTCSNLLTWGGGGRVHLHRTYSNLFTKGLRPFSAPTPQTTQMGTPKTTETFSNLFAF